MKGKKGFTLVEILVSVAIIAILSAVGLTTYNSAQAKGRDAKRKSDLRAISVALELYRQKNGRYPCTTDSGWQWSTAGGNWIVDQNSVCGAVTQIPFDTNYISLVPTDPLNNGAPFWNNTSSTFSYGYRGWWSGCSSNPPYTTNIGNFYILGTQLENKNDPDGKVHTIKDCHGSSLTWPDGVFGITSY